MRGSRDENILKCPFCDEPLTEPREIKNRFGGSFEGGKCNCGAAFVYDRSGRNLGEAYVDILTYACDDDWDRAWSLVPDEDYEIRELSFDSRRNRFTSDQRRMTPAFLFVKILKQPT